MLNIDQSSEQKGNQYTRCNYLVVFSVFTQHPLFDSPPCLSLHSGPSRSVMDRCEPRPSGKPNLERSGSQYGARSCLNVDSLVSTFWRPYLILRVARHISMFIVDVPRTHFVKVRHMEYSVSTEYLVCIGIVVFIRPRVVASATLVA